MQDLEFWAKQPEYEAWEAACLICDFLPGTIKKPDPRYSRIKVIHRRLTAEVKPCRDTSVTKPVHNWVTDSTKYQTIPGKKYYSGKSLADWCGNNGFKPRFLFPGKPEGGLMSVDGFNLSSVTDEDAIGWLDAAKSEGLTIIQAACLMRNKEPPPKGIRPDQLPRHIEKLIEDIERDHSSLITQREESSFLDVSFCVNTLSLDSIKQIITIRNDGFIPKFLENETDSKDKKSRLSKVSENNTLRALGVLALIISKKASLYRKGDIKKGTDSPNAKEIQEAVLAEAQRLGLKTNGLSSALEGKISEAVQMILDEVTPDKEKEIFK